MSGERDHHSLCIILITGIVKIKGWTKESLKRRLQKSLSHDWIHEKASHKFPLRQYYVQLEWKKKTRRATKSNIVTLTSIHDLVKQLTVSESGTGSAGAGVSNTEWDGYSVIIEGKNITTNNLRT